MAADASLTPGRVGLRELVERLDAQSRARDTYPQVPGLAALRAEADTLHARSRLRMTLHQAPAEGGPLNSAVLVHRLLECLRTLAPGYLEHFVAYADALSWLEQTAPADARPTPAAGPGGKPRAPRRRASGNGTPAAGRRPR